MNTPADRPVIQIRTPCPKRWDELVGDERRRFCSECSLHVLNAAQLTRDEAEVLVRDATQRVCMRVEYDQAGAPLFREPALRRLARWALASGAALLAACQGSVSAPAHDPAPAEPPSKMGKVCAPVEMGDVAVPPPERLEKLGEAVAPTTAPATPRPK